MQEYKLQNCEIALGEKKDKSLNRHEFQSQDKIYKCKDPNTWANCNKK